MLSLSVVLAAGVVLVLAVALIEVRQRPDADLRRARDACGARCKASSRSTCARSRAPCTAINAQFDIILGALPGIARKAAIVAERRPR